MINLWLTQKKIRKWCADNNIFYLKADILIPETVYQEVQNIYAAKLFTQHRSSDSRGWASATLHGEAYNITTYDNKNKNYHWTTLTELAPTMTNWLKNIFPNNGKYSRCRFMLLEPGGYIKKHTDTHQYKAGDQLKNEICSAINIAINQPENCYLRRYDDKLEVPFKEREVYWFNNGPFHEAGNFSKEPRFHFIIHGGTNIDRVKLFIKSFKKEFPDIVI